MTISQGAHLLLRTGKTHEAIAKAVGADRSAVTFWLSGKRLPKPSMRAKMQELFSIPVEAWTQQKASKKPSPEPVSGRSRGAVLLALLEVPHGDIATMVGVTRQSVTSWNTGLKKPSKDQRERLAAAFKIPAEAWDEAPTEAPPAVTSGPPVRGVLGTLPEIEKEILSLLESVRNDSEASPIERAKVLASCATSLGILAKFTGEFDYGRHLFRLPIWKLIEKAIRVSLKPYPQAAAALAHELRLLGGQMILNGTEGANVTG